MGCIILHFTIMNMRIGRFDTGWFSTCTEKSLVYEKKDCLVKKKRWMNYVRSHICV